MVLAYIYVYFLNTLSDGKSCLVAPGVAILPWAMETDEDRVSHMLSHMMKNKKKLYKMLENITKRKKIPTEFCQKKKKKKKKKKLFLIFCKK